MKQCLLCGATKGKKKTEYFSRPEAVYQTYACMECIQKQKGQHRRAIEDILRRRNMRVAHG
jgi:hypothetical protein